MRHNYLIGIFLVAILLPLSAMSASVTGVLNAYSFKDREITVANKVYPVDIENLPIIYGNEEVGTDILRSGLKVKLIFSEDRINQGDATIIRLRVLTHIPGMQS